METLILALFLALMIYCKPKMRYTLPQDGSYMSHDRTMMINSIFLLLIMFRHAQQNGYIPTGIDAVLSCLNHLGQFVVATFFFYSGYGIMISILKKGEQYAHSLFFRRFLMLYLNFVILSLLFFLCESTFFITTSEAAKLFLTTLLGIGYWWFIPATLLLYLLTYASYYACRAWHPLCMVAVLTGMITASILLLSPYMPVLWFDTMACFPAGAAYCILRPHIDSALIRTRMPILLLGVVLITISCLFRDPCYYYTACALHLNPLGQEIYTSKILLIFVNNVFAIIFSIGVTWLFGGIIWQRVSSFLTWFGGPAVFSIFIWHFLPMYLYSYLKLNLASPSLYFLCVFITTIVIAWLSTHFLKKIDSFIWK